MSLLRMVSVLVLTGCGAADPSRFDDVRAAYRPSEGYLLDRHGELLHIARIDLNVRRLAWTPLESISPALVTATLTAEDRRFFAHHGIDWRALAAAGLGFFSGNQRRGGSTLTMQVASKLDTGIQPSGGHRSVWQKVMQLRAAHALEQHWSKAEILEAYFNLVESRGEFAGIAASAAGLFGKAPSGLDEAEAAVLAALLRAPNAEADRVATRACAIARGARFEVSCEEVEGAVMRAFAQASVRAPMNLAPHVARRLLSGAGDRVETTLDVELQRQVTEALAAQLTALRRRNVRDGAAVVLENSSGDVLAWVGSAGPDSRSREVDGVRAARQAGSTLKPFLYGLALERRYLTAASILDDSPVELETTTGLYIPQNYDRLFKGSVSLRSALAGSLNVPAVRALTLVGVEPFRDRLREFGYEGLEETGEFYGYSLALGSAEVSLIEQANAYRTLANGGLFTPIRLQPEQGLQPARRVMDAGAAFLIGDVLADRAGRAAAFGLDNALSTRFWSAVKTGTSKDMRDNWCIGYTPHFTVAVWVGNFEGDSMHDVSGVSGAAPAWQSVMNVLHASAAAPAPTAPPGVVRSAVVFEPAIEPPRQEWFLAGTELARVRGIDADDRPHIVSPPNGAIIALDPDIPARNQRLAIAARTKLANATLELDGHSIARGHTEHDWLPVSGRHVLRLVADSTSLDEIRFEVRGSAAR